MRDITYCEDCTGSGQCRNCERASASSISSVLRRFCKECLGTQKCASCEGHGTAGQRLTTASVWQQAMVQDGLF